MFKRFLIFFCSFIFLAQVFAHAEPQLIDLSVEGTVQNPRLEITQTELTQGSPYVLVMVNNTDFPLALQFEKFGQAIFTQNLKGTPHVGQEEMGLLAHSKVLWQFIPNDPGEFMFSLSSNQPLIGAKKIKMTIKALPTPENLAVPQTVEAETVTAIAKEDVKVEAEIKKEEAQTEEGTESSTKKPAHTKSKLMGRN